MFLTNAYSYGFIYCLTQYFIKQKHSGVMESAIVLTFFSMNSVLKRAKLVSRTQLLIWSTLHCLQFRKKNVNVIYNGK